MKSSRRQRNANCKRVFFVYRFICIITELSTIRLIFMWFMVIVSVLSIFVNVKKIKGNMPKNKLHLLLAWCEIHKDELLQNWEFALKKMELRRIAPLS